MDQTAFFETCILCDRKFQFGPHRYDGRPIPTWGVSVCRLCEASNWDGVVPSSHPRVIEHLQAKGVEIKLNAKGWLPIPPRGAI